MKKMAEILASMVNEEAEKYGAFVVGQSHGLQGLFRYYVDSAQALTMQTLTDLTKADMGDSAFTFEISSPGADKPLTDIRQFGKHVGRTFDLETEHAGDFAGVLKEVNDAHLLFEKKTLLKEKGKKSEITEMINLPYSEIKSATIKLVFK
jgi:ribosome maturation factor RimP